MSMTLPRGTSRSNGVKSKGSERLIKHHSDTPVSATGYPNVEERGCMTGDIKLLDVVALTNDLPRYRADVEGGFLYPYP